MIATIVKRFVFFLSIILFMGFTKAEAGNILSRNDFDILATVDKIAITKYDLNNFIFLTNKTGKKPISNKQYIDNLETYVELIKKRIIAEKNKINLTEEENNNLWYVFSKNLNTNLSLDEYCKRNNLDKNFVLFFFESNFLWYKYVETNLKQNIEIDEETVNGVLEFMAKKQYTNKYNLSEIVLYFNNGEQKEKNLARLKDIYKILNIKNFGITAFSISQSASAKNNGVLGWLSEEELNENITKVLKSAENNKIIQPFCIGDEKGACFIFKLDDREKNIDVSDKERNTAAKYIAAKILNEKIRNVLFMTKINVVVNE